jgi:hypothetical protein
MSMDLQERRQKLVEDMHVAIAQRDRLSAAARDAATQVERYAGALALCDELLKQEPAVVVAGTACDIDDIDKGALRPATVRRG